MPIDYSAFEAVTCGLPKHKAGVLCRTGKKKAEAKAWRQTKKAVDARNEKDEAPTCFITGKRLQHVNELDPATFRDRAHLEARSQSKKRRYVAANVVSMSRLAHQLFDASAFFLLDKKGRPAKSVKAIDAFAWNRRVVAKREEPFRVRKGLAVVELDKVSA